MSLRLDVTAEGAAYSSDEEYRLLEVARAADQLGVDFIDTTEHVLMGAALRATALTRPGRRRWFGVRQPGLARVMAPGQG